MMTIKPGQSGQDVFINFPVGVFRVTRISMTHPYMKLEVYNEPLIGPVLFQWGDLQKDLIDPQYKDYGIDQFGMTRMISQTFSTNEMPDIITKAEPKAKGYLTIYKQRYTLFDGTNYYQLLLLPHPTVTTVSMPEAKINRSHFYGPGRETKAYKTPTMNLPYALSDCAMDDSGVALTPIDWFLRYIHQHAGEVADPFNRKKDTNRDGGVGQEYVIIKGGS